MKLLNAGRYTYGHEGIIIKHWGENAAVTIGSFCSIAENVTIFLGGNHRTDWVTTFPFPAFEKEWRLEESIVGHPSTKGDVVIGNDVWIGANASIMSGLTVGDGAVIGAFSVVTKDIMPYEIVAGNPAVSIRFRFKQEIINSLLAISWWDWCDEKITRNIPLLCSNDIDLFILEAK